MMIKRKTFRIRSISEEESIKRFGYEYQPILIQGVRPKAGKADFIAVKYLKNESLGSNTDEVLNPNEFSFILDFTDRLISKNNFDLEPGCMLLLQDSLFECTRITYVGLRAKVPVVIAKQLPLTDCYKEVFAAYTEECGLQSA